MKILLLESYLSIIKKSLMRGYFEVFILPMVKEKLIF